MSQLEVGLREGGELHGVLQQARACREARQRVIVRAFIILHHCGVNTEIVETPLLGDHEDLIRDGKLDVTPRVEKDLRQLPFLDLYDARSMGESLEKSQGSGNRFLGESRDDLG